MALVVPDDRLLPAPFAADGPGHPGLLEPHRSQGHHNLQAHVLLPAERPADRPIDDPYLLDRQVERVGHLFLVFVSPLAGGLRP